MDDHSAVDSGVAENAEHKPAQNTEDSFLGSQYEVLNNPEADVRSAEQSENGSSSKDEFEEILYPAAPQVETESVPSGNEVYVQEDVRAEAVEEPKVEELKGDGLESTEEAAPARDVTSTRAEPAPEILEPEAVQEPKVQKVPHRQSAPTEASAETGAVPLESASHLAPTPEEPKVGLVPETIVEEPKHEYAAESHPPSLEVPSETTVREESTLEAPPVAPVEEAVVEEPNEQAPEAVELPHETVVPVKPVPEESNVGAAPETSVQELKVEQAPVVHHEPPVEIPPETSAEVEPAVHEVPQTESVEETSAEQLKDEQGAVAAKTDEIVQIPQKSGVEEEPLHQEAAIEESTLPVEETVGEESKDGVQPTAATREQMPAVEPSSEHTLPAEPTHEAPQIEAVEDTNVETLKEQQGRSAETEAEPIEVRHGSATGEEAVQHDLATEALPAEMSAKEPKEEQDLTSQNAHESTIPQESASETRGLSTIDTERSELVHDSTAGENGDEGAIPPSSSTLVELGTVVESHAQAEETNDAVVAPLETAPVSSTEPFNVVEEPLKETPSVVIAEHEPGTRRTEDESVQQEVALHDIPGPVNTHEATMALDASTTSAVPPPDYHIQIDGTSATGGVEATSLAAAPADAPDDLEYAPNDVGTIVATAIVNGEVAPDHGTRTLAEALVAAAPLDAAVEESQAVAAPEPASSVSVVDQLSTGEDDPIYTTIDMSSATDIGTAMPTEWDSEDMQAPTALTEPISSREERQASVQSDEVQKEMDSIPAAEALDLTEPTTAAEEHASEAPPAPPLIPDEEVATFTETTGLSVEVEPASIAAEGTVPPSQSAVQYASFDPQGEDVRSSIAAKPTVPVLEDALTEPITTSEEHDSLVTGSDLIPSGETVSFEPSGLLEEESASHAPVPETMAAKTETPEGVDRWEPEITPDYDAPDEVIVDTLRAPQLMDVDLQSTTSEDSAVSLPPSSPRSDMESVADAPFPKPVNAADLATLEQEIPGIWGRRLRHQHASSISEVSVVPEPSSSPAPEISTSPVEQRSESLYSSTYSNVPEIIATTPTPTAEDGDFPLLPLETPRISTLPMSGTDPSEDQGVYGAYEAPERVPDMAEGTVSLSDSVLSGISLSMPSLAASQRDEDEVSESAETSVSDSSHVPVVPSTPMQDITPVQSPTSDDRTFQFFPTPTFARSPLSYEVVPETTHEPSVGISTVSSAEPGDTEHAPDEVAPETATVPVVEAEESLVRPSVDEVAAEVPPTAIGPVLEAEVEAEESSVQSSVDRVPAEAPPTATARVEEAEDSSVQPSVDQDAVEAPPSTAALVVEAEEMSVQPSVDDVAAEASPPSASAPIEEAEESSVQPDEFVVQPDEATVVPVILEPHSEEQPELLFIVPPATSQPVLAEPEISEWYLKEIRWSVTGRPEDSKPIQIITQERNGSCSLIALCNVLILKGDMEILPPTRKSVSYDYLSSLLATYLLTNKESSTLGSALSALPRTRYGLDVNPVFTGIDLFKPRQSSDGERGGELALFSLADVPLLHGWLVDPNSPSYDSISRIGDYDAAQQMIAAGDHLTNGLLLSENEYMSFETLDNPAWTAEQRRTVRDAVAALQFFESARQQLTYHGLFSISSALRPNELAVLFRNSHLSVIYKRPAATTGTDTALYTLVTDSAFVTEPAVVWETLRDLEGASDFVDSDFHIASAIGGDWAGNVMTGPDPSEHEDGAYDNDLALAQQLQAEENERARQSESSRRQARNPAPAGTLNAPKRARQVSTASSATMHPPGAWLQHSPSMPQHFESRDAAEGEFSPIEESSSRTLRKHDHSSDARREEDKKGRCVIM